MANEQQNQQTKAQQESLFESIKNWFRDLFKRKQPIIQITPEEQAKLQAVQDIGVDIDRLEDEADKLNQRVENDLNGLSPIEPPKAGAREGEWLKFQEAQLGQKEQVTNVQQTYEAEIKHLQRDRNALTYEMEQEGVSQEFADKLPKLDAKVGFDGEGPKSRDIIASGAMIESSLAQAEQNLLALAPPAQATPAAPAAQEVSAYDPRQGQPSYDTAYSEGVGKPHNQTIMLNDPSDLAVMPYYFADLRDGKTDMSYGDYKQNPPFFIPEKDPNELTQAESSLKWEGGMKMQTPIIIDSPEKLAKLEQYVTSAIEKDAELSPLDFNNRFEHEQAFNGGDDYFRDDHPSTQSGPSGP